MSGGMFAIAASRQYGVTYMPAPIVLDANGAPRRRPDSAAEMWLASAPSHESPAHDQWVT